MKYVFLTLITRYECKFSKIRKKLLNSEKELKELFNFLQIKNEPVLKVILH